MCAPRRAYMKALGANTRAFNAAKANYISLHSAATSSNKQDFAAALLKLLMESQS